MPETQTTSETLTKEEQDDFSKPHNPEASEKEDSEDSEPEVEPIIKARNLDFIYNPGKTNEFHALKNISLDIYQDEFIIIFGPSGCGKSTLLNVIAGLETPDSGSISVFDIDLTTMSSHDFAMYHRSQIGMIYQAYNLITSLTVLENVALPQLFVNVGRRRRERWGKTLLERFDILEHARKIPTELSGGQQQRIGIARAIVNNPKIVLADEPVGNLDSSSAKMVLDILEELNTQEKKIVIMVTHNPEYLDVADRILYMKDGEITKEVINKEKHKKKPMNKPKTVAGEINELMRAYQGMSPEQINILIMPFKSKIFANHFISSRNMEETKVFEESIQKRMLGNIKEEDFFSILKKPSDEGGVGFDKRTADNIIQRINSVLKMAFFVYQTHRQAKDELGEHVEISFEEKAEKLKDYLYITCYEKHYKNLNEEQGMRMVEAIRERLNSEIDRSAFQKYLDKPFKDGGVGLNYKTAKSMSEEIELILILGFGVVSASQKEAKKRQDAEEKKQREEEMARKKYLRENPEEAKKESQKPAPNPGEILNQMEAQLDQGVSTVSDVERGDVDNHILKEIHGDDYKDEHKKQIKGRGSDKEAKEVSESTEEQGKKASIDHIDEEIANESVDNIVGMADEAKSSEDKNVQVGNETTSKKKDAVDFENIDDLEKVNLEDLAKMINKKAREASKE